MKKLFYYAMAIAMVAMVGCNKDAEEVVAVSADAPSVNGTWVSCDDSDYKLVISGNKITATYPVPVYECTDGYWDTKKDDNNETVMTTAEQVFENGKITTDLMEGSVMSFVFDYTSTLYADDYLTYTKELKQVVTSTQSGEVYYDKVNGYLVIDGGIYADTNSYEDDDDTTSYSYSDKVTSYNSTIIPDGVVFEKE